MTDTPDKEWIERATELVAQLSFLLPDADAWRDRVKAILARELQSSFNQGVARERERTEASFDTVAAAIVCDIPAIIRSCQTLADTLGAILTPQPTEGERGA